MDGILMNIPLNPHRHFLSPWVMTAFLAAILLSGCSGSFCTKSEPTTFVVRNLTDQHIHSFSLKAPAANKYRSSRYGTIAPVPRGAAQIYLRPSSAPPMPGQLVAEWVMGTGTVHSSLVVFSDLFKTGWSPTARVLYFDLYSGGQLSISLQQDMP